MYTNIDAIPAGYEVVDRGQYHFDWNSAHWIFNFVANWAYSKYKPMMSDISKVQSKLEGAFLSEQKAIDQAALLLLDKSKPRGIEFLTDYSVAAGKKTIEKWKELAGFLMVKYVDGNVKLENKGVFEMNPYGFTPTPDQPGYSEEYYQRIANERGEKNRIPEH